MRIMSQYTKILRKLEVSMAWILWHYWATSPFLGPITFQLLVKWTINIVMVQMSFLVSCSQTPSRPLTFYLTALFIISITLLSIWEYLIYKPAHWFYFLTPYIKRVAEQKKKLFLSINGCIHIMYIYRYVPSCHSFKEWNKSMSEWTC